MSTHLAVVVTVRMDFEREDQDEPEGREAEFLALVIPRSLCDGDRPRWHALQSAASDLVARWIASGGGPQRTPRRVSACVNGQWTALLH